MIKRPASNGVLDLRQARSHSDSRRRRWLIIGGVLTVMVVIAALALAVWSLATRPDTSAKTEMRRAVERIGKLMILPAGEEPTYGTVSDKSKLSDQTFFAKAENGDEILIYQKAKLTILYRPSVNKVVNVGPIILGNNGTAYVNYRVLIKNGSGNDALSQSVSDRVKSSYPNAQIVGSIAASRAYPSSIIVDLTKSNQAQIEHMADSLNIRAGQTPIGEPIEPAADVLIIIGQDYK